MNSFLKQVITNVDSLREGCICYNGFVFTALTHPRNVYDAIVIHTVPECKERPRLKRSMLSIHDHVRFINEHSIDKAVIFADSIEFVLQCPSLKHISVTPINAVGNGFDFSPLYHMPAIKDLTCHTVYGDRMQFRSSVDYSRIRGLEELGVYNGGHISFNKVQDLKSLHISTIEATNLYEVFCSKKLDTLRIVQCGIRSLRGIEQSEKIQCVYLHYNRVLSDISDLSKVSKTLRALRIENCPKVSDFEVLAELENLELLELSGKNTLLNLSFLKGLKNLKTFIFNMNVLDGDLTECLNLQYVACLKNRKHYNLKDADLPKRIFVRGNENIELWRRME